MLDQGEPPRSELLRVVGLWFLWAVLLVLLAMWLVTRLMTGPGSDQTLLLLAGVTGFLLLRVWDSGERPGEDPGRRRRRHLIVRTVTVVLGIVVVGIALTVGVTVLLVVLGIVPLFPNK